MVTSAVSQYPWLLGTCFSFITVKQSIEGTTFAFFCMENDVYLFLSILVYLPVGRRASGGPLTPVATTHVSLLVDKEVEEWGGE